MKTKVKFSDIKFIVDPKNKVVVCSMFVEPNICTAEHDGIRVALWKVLSRPEFKHFNGHSGFYIKGVSKCHYSDDFDKKLGMKIAETRAKYKAFRIITRLWGLIKEEIDRSSEEAEEYMCACLNTAIHEEKYINKLLEE